MREHFQKEDMRFVNHECIHLKQQRELLIIFFYFWYVAEFFIRCIQYKNRHIAYRNICFEREAYAMENDFSYLKKRPFWSFIKYL